MQGLTETPTELVFDLDEFIRKQKKHAKIAIVEGICIIWVVGIGLILIIFAIWILTRTDESSFWVASKNLARIAKRKKKPVRFLNVPPEYFRKGDPFFHSQSPMSQSVPQNYPMNSSPAPVYNQPASNAMGTSTSESNFCQSCGNKLEHHQKFCSKCGQAR